MSTSAASPRALILFAHGSRDAEWAAPFRAIQRAVAAKKPELAVELAFLEIMQPSLPEAVDRLAASGSAHFTVAPLFMAQGAHLKRDLAALLQKVKERHPAVELALLPALGEVDELTEAIAAWLLDRV
jgi:sirohydrochlorin cobaltochelatase